MIATIFLMSFWCLGFSVITNPTYFLHFLKKPFIGEQAEKLNKRVVYWAKPFITCPTCMASVHGSFIWFVTGGTVSIEWVIACVCTAFVNSFLWHWYMKI